MLEAEVREEYIESKRNKSRLSASDREIVQANTFLKNVEKSLKLKCLTRNVILHTS